MILRAWPAGRLCFPAGFLFPLAPRRSQGFLRICRAPESGRSLAPAGQFTLRRQTRFKHPGPEPRCRRQTEGEAPCARERKERPGALQRGHCELRRSPRYRKRKAGHCPAFMRIEFIFSWVPRRPLSPAPAWNGWPAPPGPGNPWIAWPGCHRARSARRYGSG